MKKLDKLCIDIYDNKIIVEIEIENIEINFEKYYNINNNFDQTKITNYVYVNEKDNSTVVIFTNLINKQFYIDIKEKESLQIEIEIFDCINQIIRIALSDDFYFLHASMVEKNNYGYVVIGKTHSGKSTTAINLLEYGYNYVTDDIVGINKKNGKVIGINKPIYIRNPNLVSSDNNEIKKVYFNNDLYNYLYSNINTQLLNLNKNLIILKREKFEDEKYFEVNYINGAKKILDLIANTFNEDITEQIIIDFNRLFKNFNLISFTYHDNIDVAKIIIEKDLFNYEET